MRQVGATLHRGAGTALHRGARAFLHRGPSRRGAQAPDAQAQQSRLTGPAAPRHAGSSQTRARTRVPCISRQTLNHCATREALRVCFKSQSHFTLCDFPSGILNPPLILKSLKSTYFNILPPPLTSCFFLEPLMRMQRFFHFYPPPNPWVASLPRIPRPV